MPELPEVETIRRGLQKQIVGKTIEKIVIKKPNLVKQSQASFRRELVGATFSKIDRIGKLLIFTVIQSRTDTDLTRISTDSIQNRIKNSNLKHSNFNQNSQPQAGLPLVEKSKTQNSQLYLLIHLKMTGQLVYCDEKNFVAGGHANSKKEEEEFLKGKKQEFCRPGRFTHIIFYLKNQQQNGKLTKSKLFFNDLRQFGSLKIVNQKELKKIKSKYGIEPGQPNFTFANFKEVLQNRKTTIKALLLNQTIISGLGNIYVDESLFASKIHPQRIANSLTPNEQKRLFNAIKRIIKLAIKNNGTTFSDFVDSKGERGNFKQKLKVYGRQGQPCLRCCRKQKTNCPYLIKKIKVAGRGTYFCPVCQKN